MDIERYLCYIYINLIKSSFNILFEYKDLKLKYSCLQYYKVKNLVIMCVCTCSSMCVHLVYCPSQQGLVQQLKIKHINISLNFFAYQGFVIVVCSPRVNSLLMETSDLLKIKQEGSNFSPVVKYSP